MKKYIRYVDDFAVFADDKPSLDNALLAAYEKQKMPIMTCF